MGTADAFSLLKILEPDSYLTTGSSYICNPAGDTWQSRIPGVPDTGVSFFDCFLNFKPTYLHLGHRGFGNLLCPGLRRFRNPQCPGRQGVKNPGVPDTWELFF